MKLTITPISALLLIAFSQNFDQSYGFLTSHHKLSVDHTIRTLSRKIASSHSFVSVPTHLHLASTASISTNKSSNDNKNSVKKNSKIIANRQDKDRKPWRANYLSSTQTQEKLQKAAVHNSPNDRRSKLVRAIHVLETLLLTPPEQCNENNVVCALTLSAKLLVARNEKSVHNNNAIKRNKETFRGMLMQVLDILHELIQDQRLQSRQLCNVAWAIAKHYSSDHDMFLHNQNDSIPTIQKQQQINNLKSSLTLVEQWDLSEENDDGVDDKNNKVEQILEDIAQQLIDVMAHNLSDSHSDDDEQSLQYVCEKSGKRLQPPKPGELGMVSWAYAILYPRRNPPGWELPPRLSQVTTVTPSSTDKAKATKNDKNEIIAKQKGTSFDNNIIQFEKIFSDENNSIDTDTVALTTTDILFDTIAESLCALSNKSIHTTEDDDSTEQPLLQDCSWKELANIAWAFATRGQTNTIASEKMLIELANETISRLDHASQNPVNKGAKSKGILPRDISQIIWALGTAQSDNFHLSDGLVELVESTANHWIRKGEQRTPSHRPFERWKNADLVQLATSLAHGRIDNTELLEAIFKEALVSIEKELGDTQNNTKNKSSVQQFRSWELAVLLWTQARLYLTSKQSEIFEDFASKVPLVLMNRVLTKLKQQNKYKKSKSSKKRMLEKIGLGAQEQANLAWSLTILEKYNSSLEAISLLKHIFQSARADSYEKKCIQLEHAHQLWQAFYLLQDDCPEAVEDVPAGFSNYLKEQWKIEKSRRKTSSARHKSLSKTLELMGVAHFNEHDEDIDVAIVLKTESNWTHTAEKSSDQEGCHQKVAVEFDGPSHFVRAESSVISTVQTNTEKLRAMGHTLLKYRMLKKQGWTVVRVPYYEYDKIPFWASMERQRYLQRLLKTHADIRFSDVDVSEYTKIVPNRKSRFD